MLFTHFLDLMILTAYVIDSIYPNQYIRTSKQELQIMTRSVGEVIFLNHLKVAK